MSSICETPPLKISLKNICTYSSKWQKACFDGDVEEIELCIDNDPVLQENIDFPTYGGLTGLHNAIISMCVEAVEFLLNKGASISVKNNYQETALDIATYKHIDPSDISNSDREKMNAIRGLLGICASDSVDIDQ